MAYYLHIIPSQSLLLGVIYFSQVLLLMNTSETAVHVHKLNIGACNHFYFNHSQLEIVCPHFKI